MNNTNVGMLISKIKVASFFPLYKSLNGEITDNKIAFNNITDAIASFERSPDLHAFTSKYDYYLKGQAQGYLPL